MITSPLAGDLKMISMTGLPLQWNGAIAAPRGKPRTRIGRPGAIVPIQKFLKDHDRGKAEPSPASALASVRMASGVSFRCSSASWAVSPADVLCNRALWACLFVT